VRRVSVDIGGTFTDCFLVWDEAYVQAKALTTHHNLSVGFNVALKSAYESLGLDVATVLGAVDSVRYATTLGTNALIERKGPRVGVITTAGFESTIPLSRGRGYGEGLPARQKADLAMAQRPEALVPIRDIRGVRERIGAKGEILLALDDEDVRRQVIALADRGVEAFVVSLVNSVVSPAHEIRVEEVIRDVFPAHMLGAVPVVLSHRVGGRKGEYVRTTSCIIDAYLHDVMFHGLSSLELNLRENGYRRPMLVIHNSGGMAQLNSTHALQTIHSGPVAGVHASEHLAEETKLGNVICTDMGGTSFDIGLVVEGGVKFYDFNPVIDRWLVNVPMIHLVTLGAGGGSIARYSRLYHTVTVGPDSAGSDPGPACYDRGGLLPTVTDADLVLGYLQPDRYAGGAIRLNDRRARQAFREEVAEPLGISVLEAAKLARRKVDNDMANGIFQELRTRGFEPSHFTLLAYGGNGPLHACGIASVLGIERVLVPPLSSVFSAVGAGNMRQLHIHERSLYLQLYDSNTRKVLSDFSGLNDVIARLEEDGRDDLLRQGVRAEDVRHRLELDLRYGNQLAETAVVAHGTRIRSTTELLALLERFSQDYGKRFGEGSQAPEAGVRVNTVRVASYVESERLRFRALDPDSLERRPPGPPFRTGTCHFIGNDAPIETPFHALEDLGVGTEVRGPAVVLAATTTFLVEPGWVLRTTEHGGGWLLRGTAAGGHR